MALQLYEAENARKEGGLPIAEVLHCVGQQSRPAESEEYEAVRSDVVLHLVEVRVVVDARHLHNRRPVS
jgi:hypothetical protein